MAFLLRILVFRGNPATARGRLRRRETLPKPSFRRRPESRGAGSRLPLPAFTGTRFLRERRLRRLPIAVGPDPLLDAFGNPVLTGDAVAGHGPALAPENLELIMTPAEPQKHLGRVEGVAELLAE